MRHLIVASALLAVAYGAVARADEPSGPRAQKFAKLKKQFETEKKEMEKKLTESKEIDDKQQVNFLTKEICYNAATDALDLADENKKDETALEATVFAIKLLSKARPKGEEMDKALGFITSFHIDNPKIGPVLEAMAFAGQPGLNFLESVVEKAMNKEVLALALYYNGVAENAKASAAEGPTGDAQKIAAVRERANGMMEKAAKTAPDLKIDDLPIAQAIEVEKAAQHIEVGKPIPDIGGTDLDGKKVKLSSFKGKVVLLDFWATWCGPCRSMIPHEREMVEKLKSKPFVLLSVSVDEDKSQLTDFLATERMPWTHWHDGDRGTLARAFKANALPTLYLIDAKGVIRNKWVGAQSGETLEKAIEEAMKDAGKK